MVVDAQQGGGQLVTSVDFAGFGGMAAGIYDGKFEVGISFFRALPSEVLLRARLLVQHPAAAVNVEHQVGIGEIVGDDNAGLHRRLLIARELEDDVAAGW